jgi:hypothetical protein
MLLLSLLTAQCLETITSVVEYIQSHLQKAVSTQDMSDSEMISMLGGNGGSQVDLVFYVFAQSRSTSMPVRFH